MRRAPIFTLRDSSRVPLMGPTDLSHDGVFRCFFAEGGGLKNRRLSSFPFRFLTDDAKKSDVCAQKCAQNGLPKEAVMTTSQLILIACT